MMKPYHLADRLYAVLFAGMFLPAFAGNAAALPDPQIIAFAEPAAAEADDPAYQLYREGYHAILEEHWGAARKSFAELRQRYPRSKYGDDAEFWTAFSWKQEEPAKARAAYEKFIREYPGSTYIGDAIADLRMLEIEAALAQAPLPPSSIPSVGHEIRIHFPEELARIERDMERIARAQSQMMQRNIMVFREGDTLLAKAPPEQMRIQLFSPVAEDPEVQIRITALHTMLAGKRDASTFTTLHDLALDARQPVPVRHVALNSLTGFPEKDPATVFLAVANRDTNETIQRIAIELFAGSNRTRGDRSERLIEMFRRFAKSAPRREGALSTTLYALAAIGDDRATEFIAQIAHTEKNPSLRNDAVYYLGNIGSDRARQELLKLIRGE
jgi:hypothetical protein